MADAILADGERSSPSRTPSIESKFYVYVHSRLSTGEPFYVGKGCGNRAGETKKRSEYWKRVVAKDGGRYTNFLCENESEEFAFLVEVEAIDKYRRIGAIIINATNGGEGMSGYKFTPEQSKRRSELKMGNTNFKGRTHSKETLAKMSAIQKVRPRAKHSEEHKRKIGLASKGNKYCLGKKASAETKAKISAYHKGKQHTLGHKQTAEHKARVVAALQNRSQEEKDATSAKLSANMKRIWAIRKLQNPEQ